MGENGGTGHFLTSPLSQEANSNLVPARSVYFQVEALTLFNATWKYRDTLTRVGKGENCLSGVRKQSLDL